MVELVEIKHCGHTEPNLAQSYGRLYKAIVGNQNADIEMADEVWNFLKQWR